MKANREQGKADRIADREEMKANQAKAEAERKTDQAQMVANMKSNQEEIMERHFGSLASKLDAIVRSIRYEQDEKIQRQSENVTERQEIPMEGATVASLECQDSSPKEGESGAERREVPKKEVAVKSSRVTKKRPRGRRIAAGRRVNPTKLIRGDAESRKKLVDACRKVSCRAAVAWRKRNLVRDIRTLGNCGPRQELGAAGIMVTLRAKLARRKGTFAGKNQIRDKAGRKASRQPIGLKRWKNPAERIGRKYPGGRGPGDLRKEMTTTKDIGA
jgi:hypothetical protein